MELTITNNTSHITFACRLGSNTLLCYGPLHYVLSPEDTVTVNGYPARKPFLGTAVERQGGREVLFILNVDHAQALNQLQEVVIASKKMQVCWHYPEAKDLIQNTQLLSSFFSSLPEPDIKKTLFLFYNLLKVNSAAGYDTLFNTACLTALDAVKERKARLAKAEWILPNVLYIDGIIKGGKSAEPFSLMVNTPGESAIAVTELLYFPTKQADTERFIGLAIFLADMSALIGNATFTFLTRKQLLVLEGGLSTTPPVDGKVLALLKEFNDRSKQLLREHIAQALHKHITSIDHEKAHQLIYQLQHYIIPPYTSVANKERPFGINIEYAIPLDNKAVFLSGWIRDPLNQLEEITAISDLGFRFSIKEHLCFHERQYVEEFYKDSPYRHKKGKWGFVAYIPLTSDITTSLGVIADMYTFRFDIILKDATQYSITPKKRDFDPFALRNSVLKNISPYTAKDLASEECVRQAVHDLQQLCMREVQIKSIQQFGETVTTPVVSIVIPLYQCLDYIRVQVAHFSNDPYMQQCQIIYVLDSPEQEEGLTELLKELSALYRFPLTLVTMERNAGYAAATNTGSICATGEYLLLMNSDVIPIEYGWLEKLVGYSQHQPDAGAIGAKLLYEDNAIQHAGMYFALEQDERYIENRHFYKGYPKEYEASLISREVPAVTGACLLIRKALFKEIGKLSTDYVIGDFEDSDLCLKCLSAGYKNYIVADVELYHLERQSVPLNGQYEESSTFLYNAILHYKRWGERIKECMSS